MPPLQQTAQGMAWLHTMTPPMIHRDLKTGNLLVNAYNVVKVRAAARVVAVDADCGGARCPISVCRSSLGPTRSSSLWARLCGWPRRLVGAASSGLALTLGWRQVLAKQPYDEKADIYSFGIVVWELLTMETPYKDVKTIDELKERVVTKVMRVCAGSGD